MTLRVKKLQALKQLVSSFYVSWIVETFVSFVEKSFKINSVSSSALYDTNNLFGENIAQRNTHISLRKTDYRSLDVKITLLNEEENILCTRLAPGDCQLSRVFRRNDQLGFYAT